MRYFRWLLSILRGDLGRSLEWNQPVARLIGERLPWSLAISLVSFIFVSLIGIPIGSYTATNQYSFGDYFFTLVGFIGLAIPNDSNSYGYLSEHHSFGQSDLEAGQYAEDLAAYMLATTLGEKFDTNQIWDEEKNEYEITEDITVRTSNITQNAVGKKDVWTTAFAAAVCIL